jgi:hypothetical protein
MELFSKPPSIFEELIAPFSPEVQGLASQLRLLVQKVLPDSIENIYGGKMVGNALYSIGGPGHVICGIQPDDKLCRFYIHHISDAQFGVLKLEGKGKHTRHVKVKKLD